MTKNEKNSQETTALTGSASLNLPHTAHFLPDPSLERLLTIFGGNFHKWIHAPNSYREGADAGKPDYTTERHPIEPRVLAELYDDPAVLVGLRFGSQTHWGGFDIDAGSLLNPLAPNPALAGDAETRRRLAEDNLKRLIETAERYGLIGGVIERSSHGGGLWLKWAFPQELHTMSLAALLAAITREAGFALKSGQLEAFPNCKPFQNTPNWRKYKQFKAFRLPMQPETGAMLLNDDLEPVSDDLETLLGHLEFTASRIDMEEVRRACALAYEAFKATLGHRWKSKKNARTAWIAEMEAIIGKGFTSHHQTNDLLGKIACLGIVRDGLKGPDLAAFIEETAVALPGYALHCRHRHEITDRAREWAASAEAFYWHISDPDKSRTGSYREMHERAGTGTHESKAAAYHQRRGDTALEQLQAALEALQGRTLPTLTSLFEAACEKARELFGKAFSKRTWQKYREQVAGLIAALLRPVVPEPETPSPTLIASAPKIAETQAESGSTPCLEKPAENAVPKIAETQAQSQSTPCSSIMKVFECVSDEFPLKLAALALVQRRSPLRFIGNYAHGLVEFDENPAPGATRGRRVTKVCSIAHGAVVEILDAFHASWWLDSSQELLVYVKPQGAPWFSGVAVPFRCLQSLLE